ncbi:hypothetical protein GCM10010978_25730 [Compostibacillus humi]|uniref:Uncharacterized protein n=1 Tax=Compostibacillus humi TaxID=1245525 RepID=A0A8J2XIU2_9BACI|nr:hypothetical protein GCM10010978_25730 [Compostibacillus humi]
MRIPKYIPVACNPLTEEEIPFCSNIIAIKGSNIPWENPEMVIREIKIQNLILSECIRIPFSRCSLPTVKFFWQNSNFTYWKRLQGAIKAYISFQLEKNRRKRKEWD